MQTQLQKILTKYYGESKLKFYLSSIFTHKTPIVLPQGAVNGVEIADLLLIRQHFAHGKKPSTKARALLLQAKKNTVPESGNVASGNPNIQFNLYKNWPNFEGKSRLPKYPELSKKPWNFNPNGNKSPKEYGHYLAVYDGQAFKIDPCNPTAIIKNPDSRFSSSGYKNDTTWANSPLCFGDNANSGVKCKLDFAETLEKFIEGSEGQSFTPGRFQGTDHWSIFVNTMLNIASKNYTFTSKRTGIPKATSRMQRIQSLMAIKPYLTFALQDAARDFSLTPLFWYEYLHYHGFSHHFARKIWNSCQSDFIKDILEYARNSGNQPPDFTIDDENLFNDGGHVPILLLATSSEEMLNTLND